MAATIQHPTAGVTLPADWHTLRGQMATARTPEYQAHQAARRAAGVEALGPYNWVLAGCPTA